jgi:hypothetical protein
VPAWTKDELARPHPVPAGRLRLQPLEAGVAFLPMTPANFAVALATPRLTRRFGNGPCRLRAWP